MKLKIYGTGASAGFPAMWCNCENCQTARKLGGKNLRRRTCSCIDDKILIDLGPDILGMEYTDGLPLYQIHHILLTHSHMDHWHIDDFEHINIPKSGIVGPENLEIYLNQRAKDKYDYVNSSHKALEETIHFHLLEHMKSFMIEDYKITPIQTIHTRKEECYIYVIEHEGKTLLYAHDSIKFPESTFEGVKQFKYDMVVFDCTNLDIPTGPNTTHMSVMDNHELELKMREAGCLKEGARIVITHFNHGTNPTHERVSKVAEQYGYIPAYDGITLEI